MPFLFLQFPAFDPVLVSIGPFQIRWYALAYIAGILLGWLYARALIRNERLWGGPAPLTLVEFDDFVLWVTLGIILGGRVGYVLSRQAFRRFRRRVDYSEYGGAPLVGLNGLCIVGHGRSSAKAVANAVTMAVRAVNEDLLGRLSRGVAQITSDVRVSHLAPRTSNIT